MGHWSWWMALSLVTRGFYGFFPKLATRYISPQSALAYYVVAGIAVCIVGLVLSGHKPEFHPKGALIAVITGVAGGFFYLMAVTRGSVSIVVTLKALYPLVTILLALVFLGQPLGSRQIAGMALAICAIVLLVP